MLGKGWAYDCIRISPAVKVFGLVFFGGDFFFYLTFIYGKGQGDVSLIEFLAGCRD